MKDQWIINGKQWECAKVGDFCEDGGASDTILLFEGWMDEGYLAIPLSELQEMQNDGRAVKL